MKLLFDANLSPRLVEHMQAAFPGSQHVRRIGALGLDDRASWERARRNDFAIISKDADFRHMSMLYGAPPKVIWLRIGNAATAEILKLLLAQIDAINRLQYDDAATFMIVE